MYHAHKLSLLICFLFLLSQPLHAQKPLKTKFGKIADSEVVRSSIEDFPEAEAVYLMDIGRTYVTSAGELKLAQERHFRIKVLTAEGQSYADIAIPYYGKNNIQSVSGIKAVTHYEEGGKIIEQKISNSDVFDEDVDGYWRQKKFAMPNVKPGAVIEVKYTITSEDFTSINNWYFQKSIPVLYSKFSKEVIEGFFYSTVSRGTVIPIARTRSKVNKSPNSGGYDLDTETFIAEKIPPLKREPHIASLQDYVAHLKFQLKKVNIPGVLYKDFEKDWDNVNTEWLKIMAASYKASSIIRKEFEKITLSGEEEEKISTIYQYVQKGFTYTGRLSKYPYPQFREMLREKEGNSSAINILLLNLLKEAAVEAYPCLVSTRDNGMVQQIFPTTDQFNHQIVAVKQEDGYLLLDATQKHLPLGMLPIRDLNRTGLLIKTSGYEWISLTPSANFSRTKSASFQIKADGSLEGKITSKYRGYGGLVKRSSLRKAKDKEAYLSSSMINGFEDAELIDYELKNEQDIHSDFTAICELEVNDYVGSSIGDRIYLKPLLNETVEKNPFTLEKRTYPIDFGYGRKQQIVFSYILPEGYEVESLPEPIRMTNTTKDLTFQYQAQSIGNMLQVQYLLQIKTAFFMPQQYNEIKAFYDEIVKKHGEQIVLRQKS